MPSARAMRGSSACWPQPLAIACAALGELPVDMLQMLFTAVDPLLALRKFSRFATLAEGRHAQHFVALEDWLNDGVPLALPVARECLGGWYARRHAGAEAWHVAGRPVLARRVAQPALVVVPAHDRIVPPASAEALAQALPNAERLAPSLGHIGMIVGSAAPREVWQPLAAWLKRKLGTGFPKRGRRTR